MKVRFIVVFALALVGLVAPLGAQVTYLGDVTLPSSHGYVLPATGLLSSSTGIAQLLFTTSAVYRLDSPGGEYVVQMASYPSGKFTASSLVANAGSASTQVYLAGALTGFFDYDLANSEFIGSHLDQSLNPGTTNTLAADGSDLALADGNQIYRLNVNGATSAVTSTLMISSTANGGPLGTLGRGAFGPDGLYYTLDQSGGVTRLESYNLATGVANNAFTVPDSTSLTAGLAISPSGHIYLGDGAGGLSEYDLTGVLLGDATFTGSGTVDLTSTGGIGGAPFVTQDNSGDIFVYDPNSGMHVYNDASAMSAVPEPSTYGIWIGGLVLGVVLWRRRGPRPQPRSHFSGSFRSAPQPVRFSLLPARRRTLQRCRSF